MTAPVRSILVLALGSALTALACTKHDSLVLLDLRSSGPLVAPVVLIRLSAKGWSTRTVTGGIGPEGFRVGYYGPADGGPVSVTAQALGERNDMTHAIDCVLGKGSATVPALASGATSDPTTLFIRPLAGNDCTVVDAGSDAGGDDGGTDAAADAGADATADAGTDAASDAIDDAGTDGTNDAGDDADDDGADATAD
jgi:hypothetical protein